MNLGDLAVFESAARLGTLGAASRELQVAQPTATIRIRALERDLGLPLFHRHHHGVSLTPAGEQLLPYARTILSLVGQARGAVQHEGGPCVEAAELGHPRPQGLASHDGGQRGTAKH